MKSIALDHYKKFTQYLREELEGDEWQLPTSDISADTWSRDIDVADETPSPEDVNITAVASDEMTFAVKRALCEKHDSASTKVSMIGARGLCQPVRRSNQNPMIQERFLLKPVTSSFPQPRIRTVQGFSTLSWPRDGHDATSIASLFYLNPNIRHSVYQNTKRTSNSLG